MCVDGIDLKTWKKPKPLLSKGGRWLFPQYEWEIRSISPEIPSSKISCVSVQYGEPHERLVYIYVC